MEKAYQPLSAVRTTHFRELGCRIREMGSVYELNWVVTAKWTLSPPLEDRAHGVTCPAHPSEQAVMVLIESAGAGASGGPRNFAFCLKLIVFKQ